MQQVGRSAIAPNVKKVRNLVKKRPIATSNQERVMGKLIPIDGGKGADAFMAAFLSFMHGEPGCALVAEAQVRAVARYAYGASQRGARWLDIEPHKLFCAAVPEESSPEELDDAEELCRVFLRFLVVTKRMGLGDALFMEGWVRSARALFLDILLQEAALAGGKQAGH
jgi:hypothetical protein